MDMIPSLAGTPDSPMFSTPLPLDHGARLGRGEAGAQVMDDNGTDIIEQLLALPKDFGIIEAQYDRWSRASPAHDKWSEIAKVCTEFFEGNQWTEEERALLLEEGRPIVTKNKIAPLIRLLLGFFRQNKYDIRYLAGNDGTGTQDVAEILTACAKQISENNGTDWNDSQVFQDGLFTGRGFWDLRLDFARNRLGEVKEIVLDPFCCLIDPEADSYDPNGTGGQGGWKFNIYNRWMSAVEIFTLYGKMPLAEVSAANPSMPIASDYYFGFGNRGDISPERWFGLENFLFSDFEAGLRRGANIYDHLNSQRKLIRVIDCQHKVLKKVNFFVDLESGQEKIIADDTPIDKIQRVMQYIQARQLPIKIGSDYKEVIRWTVTAGDRVLHDKWSPYDHYTTVPYFPYFRRGKTRSPIEDLLDPQREINKRSAAFLHIVMSTANSGWIWEDGALDDEMERAIEEEGARPGINIKYQEGYTAPSKIQPSMPPMGMKKLEDQGVVDLKEIAGINDSALGQIDRVQSGKAIQARQKQSVVGAETYFDNFSHSRELKGRVILADVQTFYSEPRLIRVREGNGSNSDYMINVKTAAGEIENNVTMGKYDLAVDEAPISATFQQGQFEDALELVDRNIPIPPDILVELSSVPRKEEIKQRLTEQYMINMSNQRMQATMTKMQAGLPPSDPAPPVVTDNQNVVDVSQQGGGMPMPPGAPPGPPSLPSPGQPGMAPPGAPAPGGMPMAGGPAPGMPLPPPGPQALPRPGGPRPRMQPPGGGPGA